MEVSLGRFALFPLSQATSKVLASTENKIDFAQGGYYVYPYSASTEKYIESFYDKITAPIVKFTTGEKYDYTL